jgi:hypothetical protein
MNVKITPWMITLMVLSLARPAFAAEDVGKLVQDLQTQMQDMQKIIKQQNEKIGQLEKRGPQVQMAQPAGDSTAAPMSDYEFNERLTGSLGGANKWLKDLKFSGDLRLRYEAFHNSGVNSDQDRNRFRFRLRYGFEKKFNDEMKAGFSFASGEKVTANGHNADPTSTNQTMGNDFNFKNIWIEKAYATYTPNWAKVGPVKGLELTAGKFTNPFEKGSSDLVFDRDLKPEGIYEKVDVNILEGENVKMSGYATAGQFILQENGSTGKSDAELYGYQIGLNPIFYTPWLERPLDLLSAISYYDYSGYNIHNNWNIDAVSTGTSLANGNSVQSASELGTSFKVLNYYNELAISPYGIPFRPFADVAHNLDAGRSMRDRNAWGLGIKVGKLVKKGDWEAMYEYKWLGADSVPGAFCDSDFGYRGYAGNEGSVIKVAYNLTDYLSLNTAAYIVRNLNIGSRLDATSTSGIKSEQQSRFQLDMVWKF